MSHERRVERFYAHGVERYGSFHDNYLNFGLWSAGATCFVEAAEALLARVAEKVGLSNQSELLDVACGMGTQDRFFAERFGCRAIQAMDLVPQHIEVARAKNAHPRVSYRVGNACELPFPERTFTHVIAIEGIVHFDGREDFFREALRVLRPGGRLGVSDFVLGHAPRSRLERLLLGGSTWAWRVPRGNISTLEEYRMVLERTGYTDVELDVVTNQVIPGYYREQSLPEVRRQVNAIRGRVVGRLSRLIDRFVYELYRRGIAGYVIASGRKPA